MIPLAYNQFDSEDLIGAMRRLLPKDKVPDDYREVEDLTGQVPHVGYGGANKSQYTSPKTGRQVYVLEQSGMYASDGYVTRTWQFGEDFTVGQAAEFLAAEDAKRCTY